MFQQLVLLFTLLIWVEKHASSRNLSDPIKPSIPVVERPHHMIINEQPSFLEQQLLSLGGNDTAGARINLLFGNAALPYNLTNSVGKIEAITKGNSTTNVQHGNWAHENQDLCTLALLQGHTGNKKKFFVEAGAYDGENLSNTLLLEKKHQWTGLLVEPNPLLFKRIRQLNRQCAIVNAGISPTNKTMTIPFRLAGPLGGIVHLLSHKHATRIDGEVKSGADWSKQNEGQGEVVDVPCHPFEQLLRAAGNTDLVVDYFSLDTEGSEMRILRSIDFRKITFGVVGIEHNNVQTRKNIIIRLMTDAGYIEHKNVSWFIGHQDAIFYNPSYFLARNISMVNIDQIACL